MQGSPQVELPGSKSVAARALILDKVYGLNLYFRGMPLCDDTRELTAAMRLLDSVAAQDSSIPCQQVGGESFPLFNLGTGGTSFRFFLAYAASLPGFRGVVDCSDALRRRPVAQLQDYLLAAGARLQPLREPAKAPFLVLGPDADSRLYAPESFGESITDISSQFASALIMVADLWERPYILPADAEVVSMPYIDMTLRMRERFRLLAEEGAYGAPFEIESDWSAASYFYEYSLLHPGREIHIQRLVPPRESLQGDSICAELFRELGVETRFLGDGSALLLCNGDRVKALREEGRTVTFDMNGSPDLVPAMAVGCCFAGILFRFEGVAHLRHKESDRLAVLAEELAKAGYLLEPGADSLSWLGGHLPLSSSSPRDSHGDHLPLSSSSLHDSHGDHLPLSSSSLHDSHGDHRIAMALEAAGCHVSIGREAVSKSFPAFYAQLSSLR